MIGCFFTTFYFAQNSNYTLSLNTDVSYYVFYIIHVWIERESENNHAFICMVFVTVRFYTFLSPLDNRDGNDATNKYSIRCS